MTLSASTGLCCKIRQIFTLWTHLSTLKPPGKNAIITVFGRDTGTSHKGLTQIRTGVMILAF